MYKLNLRSVQLLVWWLQWYAITKKDKTCKIKHRQCKKLHLYSISSRAFFVQFQFDTCFTYMLPERSRWTCAVLLRLRLRPCRRVSVCAFAAVVLTLVVLLFLHKTIQVHRSLSANTCRDEPTGEKTSNFRIRIIMICTNKQIKNKDCQNFQQQLGPLSLKQGI